MSAPEKKIPSKDNLTNALLAKIYSQLEMIKVENEQLKSITASQARLLQNLLNQTASKVEIHTILNELRHRDGQYQDLLKKIIDISKPKKNISRFITSHPIALESNDHTHPWGAIENNPRCYKFLAKCEQIFPNDLSYLDLGCAGGGQVLDFIIQGHEAYGIDGSNVSKNLKRASWGIIPNHLFTADIGEEFKFETTDQDFKKFSVISAFDVLEHLPCSNVPTLLNNVKNHLSEEGVFVGTISTQPCEKDGIIYHHTVENKDWWEKTFEDNGLVFNNQHPFNFETDFLKFGELYTRMPEGGFSFVAKLNN